jgi:tetratricopeptide (TPR) repeat protein
MAVWQKRGAVHHALGLLNQAITDFTSALDEARALGDREIQGALLMALCHSLFFLHRLDDMAVRIGEAMRLADESGNEALRAWAMGFAGRRHATLGHMAEAISELDECIRLATAMHHQPALLTGLSIRGLVHFFQSEYELAEDLLIRAHRLSLDLRDGFSMMFCLYFLALTSGDRGRLSAAIATLNEATDLSRRNGERNQTLKIPNAMGWIYREIGDVDRALEHDSEGVRISRQHGVLEAEVNSVINVGYDRTLKDPAKPPVSEFHEAEDLLQRDDWLRWRFNLRLLAGKAEYLMLHADMAGAEQCARDLLENATHYAANKYIAIARKQLGEVASKRGDHAIAIDHLKKAIDVLAHYPTPIVAWKIYASLGRVLLESGDEDSARKAFTESMGLVDQIARNITDETLRNTFLNSARRHMEMNAG